MLPTKINNKKLELFYDSGASAFGIITTKNRYNKMTSKSTEETSYDANSWGSFMPICSKNTDITMEMGKTRLDLERVSYVNMYAPYQKFISPFTRIGGWLGNRPFTESVLILDTIEEEFVVMENSKN